LQEVAQLVSNLFQLTRNFPPAVTGQYPGHLPHQTERDAAGAAARVGRVRGRGGVAAGEGGGRLGVALR
jgi:hypothetical protein